MANTAERKEYPISMRLPEADVAMIDRAASLRGRGGRHGAGPDPDEP